MHARLSHQVVNKRHVVHDLAEFGHRLSQHLAGLAIRLKLPDRFHPRPQPILKRLYVLAEVAFLSIALDQLRLVVEQVEVAGRTAHKHLYNTFCPRLEVRLVGPKSSLRSSRDSAKQAFATE